MLPPRSRARSVATLPVAAAAMLRLRVSPQSFLAATSDAYRYDRTCIIANIAYMYDRLVYGLAQRSVAIHELASVVVRGSER
jgi:hypothetical protein